MARWILLLGALGVGVTTTGCHEGRAELCQDARDCALGDSCSAEGFCLRPLSDAPVPRVGPQGPLFMGGGGASFAGGAEDGFFLSGQIGQHSVGGPAQLFIQAGATWTTIQLETLGLPDPALAFVNLRGPTSAFTQQGTSRVTSTRLGDVGGVACTEDFDVQIDEATIVVEPTGDLTDEDKELMRVSIQLQGHSTAATGGFLMVGE
jgi:hypothetical protein